MGRISPPRWRTCRPSFGSTSDSRTSSAQPVGVGLDVVAAAVVAAVDQDGVDAGGAESRKVAKVSLADAQTAAKTQFAMVAKRINPAVERARAVAATRDTIEPLLKKYFKSLHRFAAKDVNRAMVAKELSRLRAERGPIAADRSRAHLSKFFNWAIAEGLAEQNPTTGTNKTGSEARTRILSDAELVAIWKAFSGDDYGDICRLLILTGARRDEIGSLARREINFDLKQIGCSDQERRRACYSVGNNGAGHLERSRGSRWRRLCIRARRERFLRLVEMQGATR